MLSFCSFDQEHEVRAYHDAEPVAEMMDRLSMPIPECGCYAWLGKHGTGGYAYVSYREGNKRFHRKAATVALELAGRPRPEGLEAGHTCLMEWCVNPDHLRWITHSENLSERRPYSRYKGNVCKRGHSLVGVTLASNGACPICEKARVKAWVEANKNRVADYQKANKDKINAQRRERRHRAKEESLR